MVITPVIVGRISIGEVVEKDGKTYPKKSDEFHITSNTQINRKWVDHPAGAEAKHTAGSEKLRAIPVRIMFDTPENNFRSGYACFNNKGRQICGATGPIAIRVQPNVSKVEVECPSPDFCEFGKANRCKQYARLFIALESEFKKDPLAGFAFRTTGYNSVNALTARINYYHALTNGTIAGMPLTLVLRSKSTAASMRQAIFYADLEPRESLTDSVLEARNYHAHCAESGINLPALEKMVSACFSGSPYIEVEDDSEIVVEEFYPANNADSGDQFEHQSSHIDHKFYEENSGYSNEAVSDKDSIDMPESNALIDIKKRINALEDIKVIPALRVWIQNHRDLPSEFEKKVAFNALSSRESYLNQPLKQVA